MEEGGFLCSCGSLTVPLCIQALGGGLRCLLTHLAQPPLPCHLYQKGFGIGVLITLNPKQTLTYRFPVLWIKRLSQTGVSRLPGPCSVIVEGFDVEGWAMSDVHASRRVWCVPFQAREVCFVDSEWAQISTGSIPMLLCVQQDCQCLMQDSVLIVRQLGMLLANALLQQQHARARHATQSSINTCTFLRGGVGACWRSASCCSCFSRTRRLASARAAASVSAATSAARRLSACTHIHTYIHNTSCCLQGRPTIITHNITQYATMQATLERAIRNKPITSTHFVR